MAHIAAVTEFDEQVAGKTDALNRLRRVAAQYRRGEETYGIMSAFERAALRAGASPAECEQAIKPS